jgi:hypothetical protein
MNDFKIGDKVKYKNNPEFLGYVSHVHKGYLFELPDYEVHVHIGNKEHVIVNESQLEHIEMHHCNHEWDGVLLNRPYGGNFGLCKHCGTECYIALKQ